MDDLSRLLDDYRRATTAGERAQLLEAVGRAEPANDARAVVLLAEACGSDEEEVACAAFGIVEDLGTPTADAPAQLVPLLSSTQIGTVEAAARLVGRLGALAGAATAPLAKLLADQSVTPSLRRRAAWALGKIGPVGRAEAEAVLIAACGDADPAVASAAVAARGKVCK